MAPAHPLQPPSDTSEGRRARAEGHQIAGSLGQPLIAWRLSLLGFALACVLIAGIGWLSYRRLVELREAAAAVEHTLRVRSATDFLLSLLKDAETGQRGFLITGDRAYLEPYETALASIPTRLERLRQLTTDNRAQQENLVQLDGLIRRKLDEVEATVGAYRSGGPVAAARIATRDRPRAWRTTRC